MFQILTIDGLIEITHESGITFTSTDALMWYRRDEPEQETAYPCSILTNDFLYEVWERYRTQNG